MYTKSTVPDLRKNSSSKISQICFNCFETHFGDLNHINLQYLSLFIANKMSLKATFSFRSRPTGPSRQTSASSFTSVGSSKSSGLSPSSSSSAKVSPKGIVKEPAANVDRSQWGPILIVRNTSSTILANLIILLFCSQ
jgi:hypothetical protein